MRDHTELRRAAIELLERSPFELEESLHQTEQQLIHELRVHQAELEMQNEELRRMQLELEESRDRFANLFDFAPVGYVILDHAGRVAEANLTICNALDVVRSNLIGQPLSRYVIREDAVRFHRFLKGIVAAEKKTCCEVTLQTPDGVVLRVRLDGVAVGKNLSIAITDLTEKLDLIRAWQDSEGRLASLARTLPMPVAYADKTQTYQFCNAAHEQWFGISDRSIAGRQVRDILGDAAYEVVEPHIKDVIDGQAGTVHLTIDGLDNTSRTIVLHYVPHRNSEDDIVGFYELMFDVSNTDNSDVMNARKSALEMQLNSLTQRQRDVFQRLMTGATNNVVAMEANVSLRTVERERQAICRLLNVASINELLMTFASIATPSSRNE
ncbi:MAG: PAS domain-containing protein [Planctomycetota bacterium]|nr:PAS domain-containing protein [Planctomycetota bacterium]